MSRPVNVTETLSTNLGTYALVSGSFNGQGASYFQGLVGKGVNGSQTTSNYYSGGQNTITVFTYDMSFTNIPSGATITRVYCSVNGHAESTSNSSEYMCVKLISGNTDLTSEYNFKSAGTSNSTQTIECSTMPTVAQLSNMKLQCRLGYYGGAINGATAYVTYTINTTAYTVTASSNHSGTTVGPATQEVYQGESASITIYTDDLSAIEVLDNGTDVTEDLQYVVPQGGNLTGTFIPSSFDSTNSVYNTTAGDSGNGIYATNYIENGLTDANSSTRCALYAVQGQGSQSYMYYNFDCSSIPSNATIQSVSCSFKGGSQGSSYYSAYVAQLCVGTTGIGNTVSVTGSNSSPTTVTLTTTSTPSRSDLNNLKIKFQVTRGSSNTTTDCTFSFFGATLTVIYTVPQTPYYEYQLTNMSADHTVVVNERIIVPPEEDPTKTYYSLTISNINATTNPGRGTTRVESGTSEVIEIYPSDPQITLVTDNGVDITSQLVSHGGGSPTYTVTTASGASYGFNLNTSTGYYTSTNAGSSKTAAVCVVNFNLPVRCLVTIQYINYAEATYDFGVFGNIDTALSNNYYAAGSGGATITDTSYRLACNTSAYNKSSAQTLTYEIPSGEHYIYIKYSKDDATDSNNDTLQFKISNIEELESNVSYYTYSLPNISQNHSLVFVFGNVSYYFVNSSVTGDARIYPDGQMVQLAGDDYSLVTVPVSGGASGSVTVIDNGSDVSNSVVEKIETVEKDGQTITVVNYIYTINNIQTTHNVSVSYISGASGSIYLKSSGTWTKKTNIYLKTNGVWALQDINASLFKDGVVYVEGV